MENYHIMFYGASGGHICAHLVLQSGRHYCLYDQPLLDKSEFDSKFHEVKTWNWDLMEQAKWRSHHSWPNNELTHSSKISGMHKLFFTCAPNESRDPAGDPDTYGHDYRDHEKYQPCVPILIWTDIDTQTELARYKVSRWFRRNDLGVYYYWKTYAPFKEEWNSLYSQHRLEGWPEISIEDIPKLNHRMLGQIKNVKPLCDFLDIADREPGWSIWKESLATEKYNGYEVERSVYLMLQENCIPIRLQEIAKTRGRILTDLLDLPWTEEHGKLIDDWLELHTDQLKSMLLD